MLCGVAGSPCLNLGGAVILNAPAIDIQVLIAVE